MFGPLPLPLVERRRMGLTSTAVSFPAATATVVDARTMRHIRGVLPLARRSHTVTNLPATLARAATELLPGPLQAAVELLRGTLGPPDLQQAAIDWLLEDIARLHRMMLDLERRLSDELRSKMDVQETFELVTQSLGNMARTAHRSRRRLMANVLVNGLADVDGDPIERRIFVRAVADLGVEHIELLDRFAKLHGTGAKFDITAAQRVLLNELAGRGFIRQEQASTYDGVLGLLHEAITDLGRRFLIYLQAPSADE